MLVYVGDLALIVKRIWKAISAKTQRHEAEKHKAEERRALEAKASKEAKRKSDKDLDDFLNS